MLHLLALAILWSAVSAAPATARDWTARCDEATRYSEARRGLRVVVHEDGRTVCDTTSNGATATQWYPIASGSKSFVGTMAAAAVQDGLLRLDEPVADTITEWRDDAARAPITIRQLLNLTSGVRGGVSGSARGFAASLDTEMRAVPGKRYQYGPNPFQIFGEVMTRKLAARGLEPDPVDYLQRRVLDPIGITLLWGRVPGGDAGLPGHGALDAQSWATFGELILADGRWRGEPLVDRDALLSEFAGSPANPAYGVTWWLMPAPGGETVAEAQRPAWHLAEARDVVPGDIRIAAGSGDQRLYVIPSRRLVIVRQAPLPREVAPVDGLEWSDAAFLRILLAE
nr:serine hydrolase [Hephaestia sp. MAHUQ-44]